MPLGDRYSQQHFVEELGLAFTAAGKPRMMGRMLAFLLICEPHQQSAGQLVKALQASKATVSTVSRDLVELGLVERIGRRGDRKTYYQALSALAERDLQRLSQFSQALRRALEHMEEHAPGRTERLREAQAFHTFLEAEIPKLIQRWQQRERTP
jgi:DNA-binding transcriptional regulator GbsR (MarR family)